MNKYIDVEKLIAEINKRMGEYDVQQITSEHTDYEQGAQDALYNLKLQLTSLQQEQPEVDLEKEICEYFEGWRINYYSETEELLKNNGCTVDIYDVKDIARHFYELGLKARKEK